MRKEANVSLTNIYKLYNVCISKTKSKPITAISTLSPKTPKCVNHFEPFLLTVQYT